MTGDAEVVVEVEPVSEIGNQENPRSMIGTDSGMSELVKYKSVAGQNLRRICKRITNANEEVQTSSIKEVMTQLQIKKNRVHHLVINSQIGGKGIKMMMTARIVATIAGRQNTKTKECLQEITKTTFVKDTKTTTTRNEDLLIKNMMTIGITVVMTGVMIIMVDEDVVISEKIDPINKVTVIVIEGGMTDLAIEMMTDAMISDLVVMIEDHQKRREDIVSRI